MVSSITKALLFFPLLITPFRTNAFSLHNHLYRFQYCSRCYRAHSNVAVERAGETPKYETEKRTHRTTTRLILRSETSIDSSPTAPSSPHRRGIFRSTIGTIASSMAFLRSSTEIPHAVADDTVDGVPTTDTTALLKGSVTLSPGISLPSPPPPSETDSSSSPALYITARPAVPDDVPRAILDGSRGKPPPVLTARLTNCREFPIEFVLTSLDLTPEGRGGVGVPETDDNNHGNYWWSGNDLIVSARWDTDGVAATRDPTDLVGRSTARSPFGEGVGWLCRFKGVDLRGNL